MIDVAVATAMVVVAGVVAMAMVVARASEHRSRRQFDLQLEQEKTRQLEAQEKIVNRGKDF